MITCECVGSHDYKHALIIQHKCMQNRSKDAPKVISCAIFKWYFSSWMLQSCFYSKHTKNSLSVQLLHHEYHYSYDVA